jgi:mercuric ion binding protein
VATSELKVVYLTAKTNVDAIRNTISMMGYDADQVKADHAAYHKLPPCCQKSGHQH